MGGVLDQAVQKPRQVNLRVLRAARSQAQGLDLSRGRSGTLWHYGCSKRARHQGAWRGSGKPWTPATPDRLVRSSCKQVEFPSRHHDHSTKGRPEGIGRVIGSVAAGPYGHPGPQAVGFKAIRPRTQVRSWSGEENTKQTQGQSGILL